MDDGQRETRFRELFEAHFGAVSAYAARRCHPSDTDDVVAETFAVAWRRLDAVPRDAPLPFLYGVARKVLANQRRGRRRWFALLDRVRSEPAPGPGFATDGPPVLEALARLKEDDREVLRLAAWEGLSHAEIAAAMGVSANAVAIRVHRAKGRLAAELERLNAPARKDPAAAGHSAG